MCLKYIQNGTCHIDGTTCILGARGALAKNENHECEMHGRFDVWMLGNSVLVTDLGAPAEEPVQDLALGVSKIVAMTVAKERCNRYGLPLATSKRTCIQCGVAYWISQHGHGEGFLQNARANFCPKCVSQSSHSAIANRLGREHEWCG